MKFQKNKIFKINSVILSLLIVFNLLSGCHMDNHIVEDKIDDTTDVVKVTESKTDETYHDILSENDSDHIDRKDDHSFSTNWEDYVGDPETFVYGLVANELGYKYDVFQASVELLDGNVVSGIGYTDYQTCYVNSDESKKCFEAGFISDCGEITISNEDYESGLVVKNVDYEDEDSEFILVYRSDPFTEHSVFYNKYVKYGVDEECRVFYELSDFSRSIVDEELGSLYSFDEAKYLLNLDVGDYMDISGTSLYEEIDYSELEKDINHYLETQDNNIVNIDVKTTVYFAQDAVKNYLLSLQEETFLGYSVDSLIQLASELDPQECYRITADGLDTINLDYSTEDEVARWLVGSACIVAIAAGTVGSMVFIECPPLSAVSGAVAGAAIETFMQVVISNKKVQDLDWRKVAIASVSGAVAGYLGPYIMATTSGAGYFFADSALDGLIGGMEHSVYAWMDGGDATDMIKSFGFGFALGFGMSAAFKGASAVAGKLASKIGPSVSKAGAKVFPKLSKKISSFSKIASKKLVGWKAVADASPFHSKYIADKLSKKQFQRLIEKGDISLKKRSFDKLSPDGIYDTNNNSITKDTLDELFDNAADDTILGYYKIGEDTIKIKKKNGMVGIVFDDPKYVTVRLQDGLKPSRKQNFEDAAMELKKVWLKDPDLMPESIRKELMSQNLELEDIDNKKIVSIIRDKENGWVLHENVDLNTITLVPRYLHDKAQGGIAHMGGFALINYMKKNIGWEFFDRFVSATATEAVIAIE